MSSPKRAMTSLFRVTPLSVDPKSVTTWSGSALSTAQFLSSIRNKTRVKVTPRWAMGKTKSNTISKCHSLESPVAGSTSRSTSCTNVSCHGASLPRSTTCSLYGVGNNRRERRTPAAGRTLSKTYQRSATHSRIGVSGGLCQVTLSRGFQGLESRGPSYLVNSLLGGRRMALARNRSMGRSPRSAGGALAFATFVVSLSAPWHAVAMQSAAAGVVQGRVEVQRAPPRRRAQRYPTGQAQATRTVQELPAVVYLRGGPPVTGPRGSSATISQQDTAFVPAVLAVPRGATVDFLNEDPFFHNVFSYSKRSVSTSVAIRRGSRSR
jgi:plastocyanin